MAKSSKSSSKSKPLVDRWANDPSPVGFGKPKATRKGSSKK